MRNAAIRHAGATYDIDEPHIASGEDLSSSEVLDVLSKLDPEDYDQAVIVCDELDMEIFSVDGAWELDGVNGPLPRSIDKNQRFYSLQDALEYVDQFVD